MYFVMDLIILNKYLNEQKLLKKVSENVQLVVHCIIGKDYFQESIQHGIIKADAASERMKEHFVLDFLYCLHRKKLAN